MTQPPAHPRTVAFCDGQNLFHAVRNAFGYTYPNYDPLKLARAVCQTAELAADGNSFLHRRASPGR